MQTFESNKNTPKVQQKKLYIKKPRPKKTTKGYINMTEAALGKILTEMCYEGDKKKAVKEAVGTLR
eukprot:2207036-Ditylum_brightwellii.AAC.1